MYVRVGLIPMLLEPCRREGVQGHFIKFSSTTKTSNIIHVETTRSRSGPDLLAALQRVVKFFADRGVALLLVRMDNKCADVTKNWLATTPIKLELTFSIAPTKPNELSARGKITLSLR